MGSFGYICRALPKTPNVVASFAFEPFHDMNGTQLQDYEDLSAEMSPLVVNLLSLEQGGAAIFSWPDSSNSAPRRFFDSVVSSDNLTSSVIHAVLDNSENFAFAPVWYEAHSEETKAYLFSRIVLLEASIAYSNQSRPDSSAPFLIYRGKRNLLPVLTPDAQPIISSGPWPKPRRPLN